MNIDTALKNLKMKNKPIRVGLIGAGYAASGFALQILSDDNGIKLVGIASRTIAKAKRIFNDSGKDSIEVISKSELDNAVKMGNYFITEKYELLCESPTVDVIVEATGDVEFGAHVAIKAIKNKKHIVLINAELDCTIGPILKYYADENNVIYTQTDGDQPGVIMNLYRYVKLMGLTPVIAGNIKTVLDHYRTPQTQEKWANENNQSPYLATTAVDGTKIAMEMATVANATGLKAGIRGMHGLPMKHVNESLGSFPLDKLLIKGGIVDYIIGAEPSFGIFVIGHTDNPIKQKYMKMYKMGHGPFYVFYRPYHLCTLETHISVAKAVLEKDATLAPLSGPVCDVVTMAKRDLKKGERLDGIGGFTCFGVLENYDISTKQNLLPMGLSKDCVLKRDISKDDTISYDDVTLPQNRLSDRLRNEQNKLFN